MAKIPNTSMQKNLGLLVVLIKLRFVFLRDPPQLQLFEDSLDLTANQQFLEKNPSQFRDTTVGKGSSGFG
jgi:hypothetical protein